MPDSVTASGKSPADVEVGASDAAGAALQAALIGYADAAFLFQFVDVGRADV